MQLNCLTCVLDRSNYESYVEICRQNGISLTFGRLATGTATGEHLSVYELVPTQKVVVSCFAGPKESDGIIRMAKEKLFIDIPGNGIMACMPLKSVASAQVLDFLASGIEPGKGRPEMNFEYEMIIVILNEGHSDEVMDAARSAGAGGGTVVHAKGTAGVGSEKFYSMSLADEKDMIYIVAKTSQKSDIMEAINKLAGPGTDAGALSVSLPISKVVGLRNLD